MEYAMRARRKTDGESSIEQAERKQRASRMKDGGTGRRSKIERRSREGQKNTRAKEKKYDSLFSAHMIHSPVSGGRLASDPE